MNRSDILPWSNNWWLEDNKAWFIIGEKNILCCFNMNNKECEVMVNIPDRCSAKFRSVLYCMKYQNDVYCFPVSGKSIWVYNIESDIFSEIAIENIYNEPLEIHDFWEFDGKIFALSLKLGQIFEINTKEKMIENYYILCKEGGIARSVKVGTTIYSLSGKFEKIYKFDLVTREIVTNKFPHIGRKYNTICFDGKNFWMGGYRKEIYLWNEEKNTLDIYSGFSQGDLSMAHDANYISEENDMPVFLFFVTAGKYNWFIPSQMDEIIYVERESHKLFTFIIAEEMQSKEGSPGKEEVNTRYILEYVRENRYLGLFSIKNNQIVEIDTEKLTYRWCNYFIGNRSLEKYTELVDYILYENNVWDRDVYKKLIRAKREERR